MSKLYLDISHHHPVKNWNKLAESCPFLITKATEGQTFVDNYFPTVVNECEKRKIPYWLYVYLRKGNVKKQIDFLIKTCEKMVGKYFVGYCLDIEEGNSASEVQDAVNYLDSKTNRKCMFYSYYADYPKYSNIIKKLPKKWAFWEARYGLNDGVYRKKHDCHSLADLHQYSSGVGISFMTGGIDVNRLTGRKSELWFTDKKVSKKENVSSETYFKKCNQNETSIINGLKQNGYNSTYKYRCKIAEVNGIKNYSGTAKQNIAMLTKLKRGKLVKPL